MVSYCQIQFLRSVGYAALGANLKTAYIHKTKAGLEWSGRMVPIAHDSRMTRPGTHVGELWQVTGKLGLNGCRDQLRRCCSQQIRQRVRHLISTRKINNVSRFYGGVSLSVGLLFRNKNSTRYAANLQTAKTPDAVIAHFDVMMSKATRRSWMFPFTAFLD